MARLVEKMARLVEKMARLVKNGKRTFLAGFGLVFLQPRSIYFVNQALGEKTRRDLNEIKNAMLC